MISNYTLVGLDIRPKNILKKNQKYNYPENVLFKQFQNSDFIIDIWFFGELPVKIDEGVTTLGVPGSYRNSGLMIEYDSTNVSVSNDWLASVPVFYNKDSQIISTNINSCVDSKELDSAGLDLYLNYGYVVMEKTPFKHVSFMRYMSKIQASVDNIDVEYLPDPVHTELLKASSTPDEVIALMLEKIKDKSTTYKRIAIPLSGGYDSRLLTTLVRIIDNSKEVLNPSYGASIIQRNSFEVSIAKKVSKVLNTTFEHIQLSSKMWSYRIQQWLNIRGSSSHLHGMYHIEFYDKFISRNGNSGLLLSGIYGDLWAGKVEIDPVTSIDSFNNLFFTHGISSSISPEGKACKNLVKSQYRLERNELKDYRMRLVSLARKKMSLLSYLIDIPNKMGLETYSPFLDLDVVSLILRLPKEMKKDRLWQKDFFKSFNVDFDISLSPIARSNTLYIENYNATQFNRINPDLIQGNKNKISKLNKFLMKKKYRYSLIEYFYCIAKLHKVKFIKKFFKVRVKSNLYDYYHLYPIQWTIDQQENR
jgi:hypothetical protein